MPPSFPARILNMIYVLPFLIFGVAAFFSLRTSYSREARLVLSTVVHRPASCVFDVISDVERAPVWHRRPYWLPGPLRVSTLACWGDLAPARRRAAGDRRKAPDEISIRCLEGREFAYRSICCRGISYESNFRLSPDGGRCLVTWEVRYQVHRVADVIGRAAIRSAAHMSMASSLEYIRHFANSREPVSGHDAACESSDQLPAARHARTMAIASTSAAMAPMTPTLMGLGSIRRRPVAMAKMVSPSEGV